MAVSKERFAELLARTKSQREHVSSLAASNVPGYTFQHPRGGFVVTSKDPSKPGRWRATRFDADGTPVGHSEAETHEAAILRARDYGADLGEQKGQTQTGPRGGQFYISPTGAKVYEKVNPGWVVEDPADPVDQIAAYGLRGPGPWKR